MSAAAVALAAPAGVRTALRRRGWDPARASEAAEGLQALDIAINGLRPEEVDGLLAWAVRAGVECVTGPDWAIVAASRARLAGLARDAKLPGDLARVAAAVGTCLTGVPPIPSWRVRDRRLRLDRPMIVGIVNITPDSFSDGGRYLRPPDAIAHGLRLLDAGADLLDLGAESTRPNRTATLSPEEERRRLLPVIEGLVERRTDVLLSIDTVHAETARAALGAGASIINDVTGLRHDPLLARACAEAAAGLIIMHSRGTLLEIAGYAHASYGDDPAGDVATELATAVEAAEAAGVERERIVVDPGLGFSKRPRHNWQVLKGLEAIVALGFPVLIGPSRKRFLGEATGRPVDERDDATAAACALGWSRGARLFRVHDVARARDALTVAEAWERS